MATDNREDGFGSRQRGEETSRLETRLDAESSQAEFGSSVMEGMHRAAADPYATAYCTYGRTACWAPHAPEAQGSRPRGGSSPGTSLAIRTPAPS